MKLRGFRATSLSRNSQKRLEHKENQIKSSLERGLFELFIGTGVGLVKKWVKMHCGPMAHISRFLQLEASQPLSLSMLGSWLGKKR